MKNVFKIFSHIHDKQFPWNLIWLSIEGGAEMIESKLIWVETRLS